MNSYPTRLVGEHVPPCAGRFEVRSTARRHRALVRGGDAAVVLGVLGYSLDEAGSRVSAGEFVARARAWQSRHDPHVVRDPDSAGEVTWTPDPDAAEAYHRCPAAYRPAFSAFTLTPLPPRMADWITWRPR